MHVRFGEGARETVSRKTDSARVPYSTLRYAQTTEPAGKAAELLEHVWNAALDGGEFAVTSMPFPCCEGK